MARAERISFEGASITPMQKLQGDDPFSSPIEKFGLKAEPKATVSMTGPGPGFNPGMGA